MRKHKISIEKVQEAFNSAIKRRDCRCMIKDYEPCCGQLECSHYFTVGSSPALRFYPPNAYAQCQRHHWKHHNVWKDGEPWTYKRFLWNKDKMEYCNLERLHFYYIKYTDELKAEIIRLCNTDKLDELKALIEENLK